MKIIFLGTPEFAVPALLKLIESNHTVVGVVTKPDKPVGRSNKPVFSPVKKLAIKHNIPVFQFKILNSGVVESLKILNADIMITCAFGQILPVEILNLTSYGVFNIHGSILPKYRGASPIQWAIINGEEKTGITILKSDTGIDTGKILLTKTITIKKYETYGELAIRLADLSAEAIIEGLKLIESNTKLTEQNHELATVCKIFTKDAGKLDFNKNAEEVVNTIHGLNPSPLAYFEYDNSRFKVYRAKHSNIELLERNNLTDINSFQNGEIVVAKPKQGLIIKCNDGFVSILEIQAESGKAMDIKNFLNGKQFKENVIL